MAAPPRDGLLQEDGGFSSFGMCCLSDRRSTPYSVHVTSPSLTYIVLEREKVDDLLGMRESMSRVGSGLFDGSRVIIFEANCTCKPSSNTCRPTNLTM